MDDGAAKHLEVGECSEVRPVCEEEERASSSPSALAAGEDGVGRPAAGVAVDAPTAERREGGRNTPTTDDADDSLSSDDATAGDLELDDGRVLPPPPPDTATADYELAVDDHVGIPPLRSGFRPRPTAQLEAARSEAEPPGAYSSIPPVSGERGPSTTELRGRGVLTTSSSLPSREGIDDDEDDGNATMVSATLVEEAIVVDAAAVDLDAERDERERLRRENEAFRDENQALRDSSKGARLETACTRRRRLISGLAAVGVAAVVAGVVGGLLGRRGRGDVVVDADADDEDDAGGARTRFEALRAVVAPLSGGEGAFDDAEEGNNNPRFAALDWLARVDPLRVPVDDPEHAYTTRQRYVLALFYFSTGGDGWDETVNFLSDEDECRWFELRAAISDVDYSKIGAGCDEQGRVKSISIWWNNLQGTLPHELAFFAESLLEINLPGHALSGTIPSEFGKLTALKNMFLHENCLSSTVPDSIFELSNLEMSSFQGNKDMTGNLNGFCDSTKYKGKTSYVTANCEGCPGSPALTQCDCCVCCDITTYDCCDKEGTRLWNHANIALNGAGEPYSFDRPCLLNDTLAHYLDNKDDLSWITDGRDGDW